MKYKKDRIIFASYDLPTAYPDEGVLAELD